jgi:hypothetical protein
MNIQTKRPGARTFVALEVALQVVAEARGPVMLRVALAWGWVEPDRINTVLGSIDRVVALLWRLTH